jgi:hypothetical protein
MARVMVGVPALLLSLGSSAICYFQTNLTLGLFLGPLILTTFFAPALVLAERDWHARLSVLFWLIVGPTTVWLLARNHVIEIQEVALCTLVLAAWLSAISCVAVTLHKFQIDSTLASTVTVIASLGWLTWPIWLSPLLASHQRAVGWLCWAHPIMSMNWVVRQLGLWGSPMGGSDFAYRYLTILNQDVSYPHSQSIWPCFWVHALFAITLSCALSLIDRFRKPQRTR